MKERLFSDLVYKNRKGETDAKKEERLWRPRRIGEFYCSPRCGYKCTWANFQLATKRAKALCKLLGPGWVPHVWENGGWHYKVAKSTAEITADHYTSGDVHYSVWLQSDVTSVVPSGVNASMQVILNVPGGMSDIHATLHKALTLKKKAALTLLAEVAAVEE